MLLLLPDGGLLRTVHEAALRKDEGDLPRVLPSQGKAVVDPKVADQHGNHRAPIGIPGEAVPEGTAERLVRGVKQAATLQHH